MNISDISGLRVSRLNNTSVKSRETMWLFSQTSSSALKLKAAVSGSQLSTTDRNQNRNQTAAPTRPWGFLSVQHLHIISPESWRAVSSHNLMNKRLIKKQKLEYWIFVVRARVYCTDTTFFCYTVLLCHNLLWFLLGIFLCKKGLLCN